MRKLFFNSVLYLLLQFVPVIYVVNAADNIDPQVAKQYGIDPTDVNAQDQLNALSQGNDAPERIPAASPPASSSPSSPQNEPLIISDTPTSHPCLNDAKTKLDEAKKLQSQGESTSTSAANKAGKVAKDSSSSVPDEAQEMYTGLALAESSAGGVFYVQCKAKADEAIAAANSSCIKPEEEAAKSSFVSSAESVKSDCANSGNDSGNASKSLADAQKTMKDGYTGGDEAPPSPSPEAGADGALGGTPGGGKSGLSGGKGSGLGGALVPALLAGGIAAAAMGGKKDDKQPTETPPETALNEDLYAADEEDEDDILNPYADQCSAITDTTQRNACFCKQDAYKNEAQCKTTNYAAFDPANGLLSTNPAYTNGSAAVVLPSTNSPTSNVSGTNNNGGDWASLGSENSTTNNSSVGRDDGQNISATNGTNTTFTALASRNLASIDEDEMLLRTDDAELSEEQKKKKKLLKAKRALATSTSDRVIYTTPVEKPSEALLKADPCVAAPNSTSCKLKADEVKGKLKKQFSDLLSK